MILSKRQRYLNVAVPMAAVPEIKDTKAHEPIAYTLARRTESPASFMIAAPPHCWKAAGL
jgi:hypothetical protein